MTAARIVCHPCAHYFVTWDENFPHGCRRMGFKSRRLPSEEVRRATGGAECRLFAGRPDRRCPAFLRAEIEKPC
ncbi:MAG: hypothetical protein MUC33_18085 [Desulfobacterales bacterium]|jgi:hypothetical protein|nr:hypothetical protein [Desulfobacterales bacterium]